MRRNMCGVTVDNVVTEMCCEEYTRNAVDRAITGIVSVLQRKWCKDQRA